MAVQGSYQNIYGAFTVRTEWEAIQNTEKNYSDLTIKLYLEIGAYNSLYIGSRTHTVNIAGTDYNITSDSISSGSGTVYIGSLKKRIYHNSDGTLSVELSTTFDMRATINGGFVNSISGGSDTITLDKIPRMSTISDTMDGSRELGTSHTIHIDKYLSGNITHTIWYRIVGEKGNSDWFEIVKESSNLNISFIPSKNYNHLQPNSNNIYMDLCCRTFKNGERFGEDVYSNGWYMKVPSNVVPTIRSINIFETVDKCRRLGVYVQNHSKLRINTNASGVEGSTIKSIKVQVADQTFTGEEITTAEILESGNIVISVTVTDSRDKTTTNTRTVKIEPYALPSILKFTGDRLYQNETTVSILRNFTMSSLAGRNTCNWKIEKKIVGGSNWTTVQSGTNKTLNEYKTIPNISTDYEYEFRLTISDFNTSTSQSFVVYTSFALLDFHKSGKGLAIGRSSTLSDMFDVDIKTLFRKEVEFQKGVKIENLKTAQLQNSWIAYESGQDIKFLKDNQGIVYIQGAIKNGNAIGQVVLFNLPVGYRPQKNLYFRVLIGNYDSGAVRIDPNGNVVYVNGRDNSWLCLDGICFRSM